MALQNSTTQVENPQKRIIILSNGEFCHVPEGADADYVLLVKESAIRNTGRKRRQRRESGKPKARVNYAERVTGRPCHPSLDPNYIIIHSAGGVTYVSRESGKIC